MPNERILVTGANGFIGRVLVRHLIQRGFRVRAVVRNTETIRSRGFPTVDTIAVGDVGNATDWSAALLDIDIATLTPAVEKLQASHREDTVLGVHCDVSIPAQVQNAITKVDAAFGRIDALVNNAGIAVFKPIGEKLLKSGAVF